MECMENYTTENFGKVYLADDKPLNVVGKDDVKISTDNGTIWKLKDVRHIPGLKRNLISMGQLDSEDYATVFVGNSWKVTKGAMVVARGNKLGTLYMTTDARNSVAIADSSNTTDILHCRLGHMSEKGMKVLHQMGRLPDLKSIDVGLCEDCVLKGI